MLSGLAKQVQGRVQELWGSLTEYEIPKISADRAGWSASYKSNSGAPAKKLKR